MFFFSFFETFLCRNGKNFSFRADACTKNGQPTIRAKRAPIEIHQKMMGNRDTSNMDILKLNELYACANAPPTHSAPAQEQIHNVPPPEFPANSTGTGTDAEMQERLKVCLEQTTCSRRNTCCSDLCHRNKQYLGDFKCSSLLGAIREFSCSCTSERKTIASRK